MGGMDGGAFAAATLVATFTVNKIGNYPLELLIVTHLGHPQRQTPPVSQAEAEVAVRIRFGRFHDERAASGCWGENSQRSEFPEPVAGLLVRTR